MTGAGPAGQSRSSTRRCPASNRSKVWAYGLRNPFRFTDPPRTSEPYIGDVGWNTWEEIDTGKGANFGWPCYEGGAGRRRSESGTPRACSRAAIADTRARAPPARRSTRRVSARCGRRSSPTTTGTDGAGTTAAPRRTAGLLHRHGVPAAVPERALHPRLQPALDPLPHLRRPGAAPRCTTSARETATAWCRCSPARTPTSTWCVLSGSGSQVRRIRYIGGGNTPPTAVVDATPTIGIAPLAVTFSSLGSFDPDAQPLSYGWDFGDGATSTQRDPTTRTRRRGLRRRRSPSPSRRRPSRATARRVRITVGNEPAARDDHGSAGRRHLPGRRRDRLLRPARRPAAIPFPPTSSPGSCACTTTSTSTTTASPRPPRPATRTSASAASSSRTTATTCTSSCA